MLTRTLYGASLIFASLTTIAAAQNTGTDAKASPSTAPTSTMAVGSGGGTVSAADRTFVTAAAENDLAEIAEGQLAQQKGNKKVQTIGTQMITDHTKLDSQLKAQAQSLGLTVPTTPSLVQQSQYTALQGLSGASFNHTYLTDQRAAHKLAITVFETEASNGQNPALKQMAMQSLPILKEHLKMITAAKASSSSST